MILAVAFVISLAVSMIASVAFVSADTTTPIPTTGYVCAIPKTIGINQTLLISGWITPPPNINWDYAGLYFDVTNPDGTTTTKGPYNSFGDGTTYFTMTPAVTGQYSVILRWAGGNNTVDYYGNPMPPVAPYQPVTSESFNFTVQQEPVQIGPSSDALPTGYWSRPISSELRSWSDLSAGGDWLYSGGFGDSWRPDGLGNNQVNPFSSGPATSHVVWTKGVALGGMEGGASGAIANPGMPLINVIISGVGYYQLNGLHAVDMQTGNELWVNPAMTDNPSFGQPATNTYTAGAGSSTQTASLWVIGATAIKQYNAQTGALMNNYPVTSITNYAGQAVNVTNFAMSFQSAVTNNNGGVMIYLSGQIGSNAPNTGSILVCFNSSRPGNTFASKIQWTAPGIQVQSRPFIYLYNDVVISSMQGQTGGSNMSAYNATTGTSLWNVTYPFELEGNAAVGYDKLFTASGTDRTWRAIDVYSGQVVWQSQPADFPFGAFWAYSTAVAYNIVYGESYDGHLYAFNATNGQLVWRFYSGDTTATPFNTWPFYARMVVADGKIYAGTTEHSPTQPYTTGNRLYCIDALSGTLLWSVAGQYQSKSIADGVLVAVDDYTGQMFAWCKGPTSTTVSLTSQQITQGQSVGITGYVLDQSPAQLGTPAVSKDSMTGQMEYLHVNRPAPTNTTGVPVTLYATAPDGTSIPIGETTSDAQGHFSIQWTPPDAKLYKITANFTGDNSYWGSSAIADINVIASSGSTTTTSSSPTTSTPAISTSPSTSASPATSEPPNSQAPEATSSTSMTTYIAIAAVVVIIVVVAAAIALRRRK